MQRAHVVGLPAIVLSLATQLSAQERESGLQALIDRTGQQLVWVFARPLHPVFKGVAPGGGPGVGIEYRASSHVAWRGAASAVVTARSYWSAEVGAEYRGDRASVQTYARTRDMSRLDFYGPGNESDVANRSNFRLRDRVVGASASARLVPWLQLGARGEELWPDVRRGRSSTLPSIEQLFDEGDAPGLTRQPRFGRYEASIDVTIPAGFGEALHQGAKYRVTHAIFADQRFDRFTFQRFDVEAQQRFALFGTLRRLTLHGWLSAAHAGAGNEVPFYFQRTLGGHSHLRSPREELIGSDGSRGTLRGFPNYRFRDRTLLLFQVEYRVPIWGPVDATVFADAGKVTRRREDLDLAGLRRNYGFSLSVMRGPTTAARVEIGFGGGEGARIHFTVGRDVVP